MIEYFIPYGKKLISIYLPENLQVDLLQPKFILGATDPAKKVEDSLNNPINNWGLSRFQNSKSVAIAINDKTRPVPNEYLLPPLLSCIERMGKKPDDITLIIAPGTHKPMVSSEFSEILPIEITKKYRVICHDARDNNRLVYLGRTTNGTPIWINKEFYNADLRVTVGDIEPHHFMGFSGGVKTPAIGLAGMETINVNHSLMKHPNARLGHYEDNPVRIDVEEIGEYIGVHFCLNAILNIDASIVHVLAGNPKDIMLTGIKLVREIYEIPVKDYYDLVIASPGGYPRDINVVQSEKGLSHAAMITKAGGSIILLAECSEGSGNMAYEEWMNGVTSYEQVLKRFENEELTIGPHKAYQIAQYARNAEISLFTELGVNISKKLLLRKINNLEIYLGEKIKSLQKDARIALMPKANTTIPRL